LVLFSTKKMTWYDSRVEKVIINRSLIRPIPLVMVWFTFYGESLAMALNGYLYFPKNMYEDLLSSSPSHESLSVYVHEYTHIERQRKYGHYRWMLHYIFFRSFRLEEELAAIREEMKYRHAHNLTYNITRKSRHFSSSTYLWILSYDASVRLLTMEWQAILSRKY
jgi:hypothetical protein